MSLPPHPDLDALSHNGLKRLGLVTSGATQTSGTCGLCPLPLILLALAAFVTAGCSAPLTWSSDDDATCFAPTSGDPDNAIAACSRIVTFARLTGSGNYPGLAPRQLEAESRTARAVAYDRKGETEKAMADLDAAIRANKKWSLAYALRADLLLGKGDLEAARRDLREAVRLDPSDEWAKNNLAEVERRLGVSE